MKRFKFNNGKIVIVQNVNSITRYLRGGEYPGIDISFTSNKTESVEYESRYQRDNDFNRFEKGEFID